MRDLNTNRCGKTVVGFVRPAESGVYLPLLASGVFVLLIVIGLAIDSARLYRAKIEVQQIVDAAALASARILVNSPSATLAGDAPRVYNDSLQLVGSNLLAAGYSPIAVADLRDRREGQSINTCLGLNGTCCYVPTQPFMCAGEPSEERRYVEVSMRLRIPTLILGILPGFREGNYVSARGIIENLRMQTVLVLDQSGSMDENWSGQTKGQFLKTAAKAFVDTLLPFDELAIVAFSANVNGQSDQTVALSTSGGREPQADPGASNPTDGWEITMNRLRSNYANDSQRIFPTTQQSLVQVGDGTVKGAAKDAIDALVFGGNTDIGSGIWRANTLLDNAGGGDANILKLIVVVTDGAPNGSISNYLPITWWNVGERPRGALSDDMCENHPLWTTLLSYSTSSNATTQNNRRQRLRALDAIIESDLSRENGYVVYSIGVGQEDSNLLSPFQNIGNLNGLKRFLLRRIANDQSAMRLAQPFPDPEVFTPLDPTYPWDFPCVPQGAAIAMKPRGQYLLANSGPALIAAFREVASVRSRFQQ